MQSSPRLQSVDEVPSRVTAIKQPLVLLLENGPAFSALFSDRVSAEPDDGSVILEDCTQIRIERNGDCICRRFRRVVVSFDGERNHWIASPDNLRSMFSQPSFDPYVFVQLRRSQSERLMDAIRERDFDSVFDDLRQCFAALPRFYSSSPTELRAPENYATGRSKFPEVRCFL